MKKFYLLSISVLLLGPVFDAYAQKDHNEIEIEQHAISHDKMLKRLMRYISIESYSEYSKEGHVWTMTPGQKKMAKCLASDAKALGADVYLSPDNYVYVTVPSNIDKDVPVLGISSHLDYSNEAPHKNLKPSVIKYEGGDIVLNKNMVLSPDSQEGKDLKNLVGKTIIHTDGKTLLGGDCKNGCTVAMSVLETIMKSDMKHGKIQFVWCPNEDIGLSAERLDTTYFNPDILYDIDAEGATEVSVANFTARGFIVKFIGKYAHPGDAKAMGLGDALAAAAYFTAAIPLDCRPEHSEGTQGYMQAYKFDQDGNDWTVTLRLRYFDKADGERYDAILTKALDDIRRDYPAVGIEIIHDRIDYENVAYSLHPEALPVITRAAERIDKELNFTSTRGGTTASMMAAKGFKGGLFVFSGQHAIHSVYEYSVLEEVYEAYMLMLHAIDEVTKL